MRQTRAICGLVAATALASAAIAVAEGQGATDFVSYRWTKVYDGNGAGWAGRAGLQAVQLNERLYVMGGRTPFPTEFNPFGSVLWDDVWESRDVGTTWRRVAAGPVADPANPGHIWSARGYFQAVTKGDAMFVLGGQVLRALALLATLFAAGAASAERVLSWETELYLEGEGAFGVVERIRWDFEGAERHGILRDIPVAYGRGRAADYRIRLEVEKVTDAEGRPRPWRTQRGGRLLEIRIGDPDRSVSGVEDTGSTTAWSAGSCSSRTTTSCTGTRPGTR